MNVFKRIQWAIEFGAYRIMESFFAVLSPEQVYRIGHFLGLVMFHPFRSRRVVVTRNLRIAFGDELNLEQIRALTREVFACSGANLLSSIRSDSFTKGELDQRMRFPQIDEFRRLHRHKKGLILLVPHMGNWELLAEAVRYLAPGDLLATHYRKLNNPYLNARIEAQRSKYGTQLFSKDDSPHAIVSLLRAGGAIGILADQRAGSAGYWATYYNHFTTCSPLPEILSKRTGADVALMYIRTTSPAHWEVVLETLDDTSTPACMQALERATRSSPSDVFWFQDRWRLSGKNPFGISGKPHPKVDLSVEEKPLRLLIWLSSPKEELPVLPEERRRHLELSLAYPERSTPPSYPDLPWHKTWPLEAQDSVEYFERILGKIDEDESMPLAGVIVTQPSPALEKAAVRVGLTYSLSPKA